MADESYSFSTARTRLEEIVTQVRKKDTSLEKSLDLLEEGVRLANACTELIDHADWAAADAAARRVRSRDGAAADVETATEQESVDARRGRRWCCRRRRLTTGTTIRGPDDEARRADELVGGRRSLG